jgi:hypothetical protein
VKQRKHKSISAIHVARPRERRQADMDYFRMNANTQIERRLRGIEDDLQEVGHWGRLVSGKMCPLENEVVMTKNFVGSSDEKSWPKRFEEIQNNRTIFQLKSLLALEKISDIVTEVRYRPTFELANTRDNAPTIWLVNTPLTGELLWFYVVWTFNVIVGAWYYGESAKFCDGLFLQTFRSDQVVVVTRAFMAGQLRTTRFPWVCLVCSLWNSLTSR